MGARDWRSRTNGEGRGNVDGDCNPGKTSIGQGLSRSSIYLLIVVVLTLADLLLGWRWVALLALPVLVAYFIRERHRLIINSRVLLFACAALAIIALFRRDAAALFATAASRTIYLPTFLVMLGFLRAAASGSDVIASAGRYLVNQAPSRRFLSLALGGHVFGILFNIGGLALIVDMTKQANTLSAAGNDPAVVDLRERRMTTAIMCGFAAMVFWSPLGVAMNLILASIPGLSWGEVIPVGLLLTVGFIGLGWILDLLLTPSSGRAVATRTSEPGGGLALATVVGHIAAISLLTGAADYLLRFPFQTALLIVVPLYAYVWAVSTAYRRQDQTPYSNSLRVMIDRGVSRFPTYANEVAMFAVSGFLGAMLTALIPREWLQAAFVHHPLPPGVLAALISISTAFLGFIGLTPMVTAGIVASALSSIEIPGFSKLALTLAIVGGWAGIIAASPMGSSLVMVSTMIGRSPWQVAVKWSGPLAVASFAICVILELLLLSH